MRRLSLDRLFPHVDVHGSSVQQRSDVRSHRILCVLGAVFVPTLGGLFAAAHSGATDPTWARLGVGALFTGLLAASYVSNTVREHYPVWMRAVLYVLMGWFATVAALNGFEGEYDMGLLLIFGVLPPVVALGAESMKPVWRFLGFGLLAGALGIVLGNEPVWELLALSTSMVTVAVVEGTSLRGQLTVQKKAKRLNDLFGRAQDIAAVGAWEIDLQDGRRFWTDQVHKIYRMPTGPVPPLEREIDRYHPDDRPMVRKAFDHAVEDGEPFDLEARLAPEAASQARPDSPVNSKPFGPNGNEEHEYGGQDDQERWVHLRGEPQRDAGTVTRVRGTVQDVTDRKWKERQLQQKNQRLDRFAQLLSHDLRNPLNVAKGRLELVKETLEKETLENGNLEGETLKTESTERVGKPNGHLDAVDRALGRMDTIINDVLTLTWSEQEISPDEMETLRLADVAETSWSHVDTAQASLHLEADADLRASESRLRRLLENLFRNAVEHGGPAVSVQVGPLPDGFYVENNGDPIPPEKRDEVIRPGYSTDEEGTGLGLSIVTSIAEAHGWALRIADRERGGPRFEVTDVKGDSAAPMEADTCS